MSIASELTLLNNTKQAIKTAINNKGVTVTDEPFAAYPDKVRLIPSGSGTYESNVILFLEGRLKNLVVPSNTTTIRDFAYTSSGLVSLTIPSSVTTIGKNAFCCNEYLTTVNIANGVTTIGEGAFSVCDTIPSLIFPDSVTSIGLECCYMTAVSYVEFGTGIQSIGVRAFSVFGATFNIKATTPPTLGTDAISSMNDIYVPDNSVLDYQVAWPELASCIKPVSQMPS